MGKSEQLANTGRVWERLARNDPLWAILSERDKRGRKWRLDEFLATGHTEVAGVIRRAHFTGEDIHGKLAIDFGCGVGRWSHALRKYFTNVIGIDVSETMVKIATDIHGSDPGLSFQVNDRPDLSRFGNGSVDFVSSHITLQHIPASLAMDYILEFFRIVRPGGHVYFQMPSHLAESAAQHNAQDGMLISEAYCYSRIERLSNLDELRAGCSAILNVKVTNLSEHRWPQLNLGNHWRTLDGGLIALDDGRTALPVLQPNTSTVVGLDILAPAMAGDYYLEQDLVQEGIMWFSDTGRTPYSEKVHVQNTSQTYIDSRINKYVDQAYSNGPAFEMNGIHRDTVLALAARNRMQLIQLEENRNEWIDYGYIFRKIV